MRCIKEPRAGLNSGVSQIWACWRPRRPLSEVERSSDEAPVHLREAGRASGWQRKGSSRGLFRSRSLGFWWP